MSRDEVNIASYLSLQNGIWVFEIWNRIPEPDEGDFHCTYPTYEEAERVVRTYRYGEPTNIDGWLVPLHRHPELKIEGVKDAIASAIHVSQYTFDGISERRRTRMRHYYWVHSWRKYMWERTYQSQFLEITHQSNKIMMLQLRRDMQECYIINSLQKSTGNQ